MWCLSFADLFWFCYPDCKYCSNWFTSKTAFLTNSTELKEEVVPSTLFLNSSPCLSTVTIDSRCLKTSSVLDTDFEEILIPDYQTSTKSILKDLRVKANETGWNTALNQLRPLAKVQPLWASYLLFTAEFHTDLLNCDNFSTSHDTPLERHKWINIGGGPLKVRFFCFLVLHGSCLWSHWNYWGLHTSSFKLLGLSRSSCKGSQRVWVMQHWQVEL